MDANQPDREKEPAIVRLYRAALYCFPEKYRREYGDELLYAVRMSAAEAQDRATRLRLAWRELRDLPLAIVRANLRERSLPMDLRPGAHLPGGPIRICQLGAILLPFLLLLVFPLNEVAYTSGVPWLLPALCVPFLLPLVVVWIAGLVRNFPVWALPALGMVFLFVSAALKVLAMLVVFTAVFLPVYGEWGWPRGDIPLAEKIGTALLVELVFLLIAAAVVAALLRAVPSFHARLRQEWTLLSFLLFSIAMASTWLWGDEYHGVEAYQIASLLILALGAVLYLVAPRRWQRALALVLPAVLAPVVMSFGLYQAFPAQSWANPASPPYSPPELLNTFRWWEALQPVLGFSPLPVLLLLAALAPRLPFNGRREPAAAPAPNPPLQGREQA